MLFRSALLSALYENPPRRDLNWRVLLNRLIPNDTRLADVPGRLARATRRRTDAVLGRAEVTHARDQARAVLAAGALNNTAA